LKAGQNLLVIFGPEGGLSPEEIDVFTQLGAVKIGLGPRIMRAETAPMYVLSAISFYTELMG
jgi:16S rRNA (uracil1498-N3)-methyltransferase